MSLEGSTWDLDKEQGAIYEEMISDILFPKIMKNPKGQGWDCHLNNFDKNDKESVKQQFAGVDVTLETPKGTTTFDVKALNKDYLANARKGEKTIQTFCVELVGNSQKKSEGWFLNESKTNDGYIFVWIHDCNWEWHLDKSTGKMAKALRDISALRHAEVVMFGKEKLKEALKKHGCTEELLKEAAEKMCEFREVAVKYDPVHKREISSTRNMPFYIVKSSGKVAEEPVNLVIRKEFYYSEVEDVRAYDVYPQTGEVFRRFVPFVAKDLEMMSA